MAAGETLTATPKRPDRLRLVRQERTAFDGRFFERRPEFWPIARAASRFADRADWPDVAEYAAAFDPTGDPALDAPVRFEPAPARRRRPPGPIVRADLYDATIVRRRVVPTRARMWHDYLNALVWATFPRSKLAFHERQHAAIERWIPEGATRLPNARTRELDALALVDEGGVLVVCDGERRINVVFGHALFEGLALEQPAMVARAVMLDAPGVLAGAPSDVELTRRVDRVFADVLRDVRRIVSPEELPRLPLVGA